MALVPGTRMPRPDPCPAGTPERCLLKPDVVFFDEMPDAQPPVFAVAQQLVLENAHAEAERANAAKGHFLATMSHELRTPLNAIIGFSEMLVNDEALNIGAARRRDYAQLINDSGQHLLSVVNGILDMSRIEAGGIKLAIAGVVSGVVCALLLSKVVRSLLFEVGATDPATFAAVAVIAIAVASLAWASRAMTPSPWVRIASEARAPLEFIRLTSASLRDPNSFATASLACARRSMIPSP